MADKMTHSIQIINPLNYDGWDDLVLSSQGYSFFHSLAWAKTLSESYNYNPLYFSIIEDNKLIALIPVMEIKSNLTGRRGVSLPFSDFCEPIFSHEKYFQNLFQYIISYGKDAKWKYLELRTLNNISNDYIGSLQYYHHTIDLSPQEEKIFYNFKYSARKCINRATRKGVKVVISQTKESLMEFYRLLCITRKKLGVPPQPWHFFEKFYEHIIITNSGFLSLALYNDNVIGGLITSHFGDKVIFKYGASDQKYYRLNPNNMLIWEALKQYAQNGYKSISLGRTDFENEGLRKYKIAYGANETIITNYKYDFKKEQFIQDTYKEVTWINKLLKKAPLSLLKITGSLLYKHMG